MRGKFWSCFLLDLLPRRVRIARVQIRKRPLRAIEQPASPFHCHDRILKRRLLRAVRNRIDFV